MSSEYPTTVSEVALGLAKKDFSSVELTQALLTNIHQHDPKLNSFISICDEYALTAAKAADERRQRGEAETLTGVPVREQRYFLYQWHQDQLRIENAR